MVIQSCSLSVRARALRDTTVTLARAHTSGQNTERAFVFGCVRAHITACWHRKENRNKLQIDRIVDRKIKCANKIYWEVNKWFWMHSIFGINCGYGKMRALSVCECSLCQSHVNGIFSLLRSRTNVFLSLNFIYWHISGLLPIESV